MRQVITKPLLPIGVVLATLLLTAPTSASAEPADVSNTQLAQVAHPVPVLNKMGNSARVLVESSGIRFVAWAGIVKPPAKARQKPRLQFSMTKHTSLLNAGDCHEATINPQNTVVDIYRLVGRKWVNESRIKFLGNSSWTYPLPNRLYRLNTSWWLDCSDHDGTESSGSVFASLTFRTGTLK